jgi:hypothetical protein
MVVAGAEAGIIISGKYKQQQQHEMIIGKVTN